jgi:two-component system response regulator VicR
MFQPNILIITDHFDLAKTWVPGLGQVNAKVSIASCNKLPDLKSNKKPQYDAVIIDTYTANFDFVALSQSIRKNTDKALLLLTYDRDERLHLLLYQAGVAEVIVKPISVPLFLAKVAVWLQQAAANSKMEVETKSTRRQRNLPFQLDTYRRLLVIEGGKAMHLSALECSLLSLLMHNEGQVLDPDLIIDRVWSRYGMGDKVMLKNLIHRLRRKVEPDPALPRYIHTVKGQGYLFQVESPRAFTEAGNFATKIASSATHDTNFDTSFDTLAR